MPESTGSPGWTVLGGFTESDDVPGLPSGHWALPWTATGDSAQVTDPLYGNQRALAVHDVAGPGGLARFAVTEVSNGVYLVAVPTPRDGPRPTPRLLDTDRRLGVSG